MNDKRRHPIFSTVPPWSGLCPANCDVNHLGAVSRKYFMDSELPVDTRPLDASGGSHVQPPLPPVDSEEYFEYAASLSAVAEAEDHFVMMELGAGYGRWLVNAALAMRRTKNLPCRLIGVEAEPSHFAMLRQHFADNGLHTEEHRLIQAAVAAEEGIVRFPAGASQRWWGQSILKDTHAHQLYAAENAWEATVVDVPAVSLSSLLESETVVDLLDMDIQGTELEVVASAQADLDAKVKRIFIGTHGRQQETGLRRIFAGLGWYSVYDFPNHSLLPTFSDVLTSFQDGVQFWVNPRFVKRMPSGARLYPPDGNAFPENPTLRRQYWSDKANETKAHAGQLPKAEDAVRKKLTEGAVLDLPQDQVAAFFKRCRHGIQPQKKDPSLFTPMDPADCLISYFFPLPLAIGHSQILRLTCHFAREHCGCEFVCVLQNSSERVLGVTSAVIEDEIWQWECLLPERVSLARICFYPQGFQSISEPMALSISSNAVSEEFILYRQLWEQHVETRIQLDAALRKH